MSVLHGFTTFYAYVCYGKHLFRLLEFCVGENSEQMCSYYSKFYGTWLMLDSPISSMGSHYFSAVYLTPSHISHRGFYYEAMFAPLNQILYKMAMLQAMFKGSLVR